MVHNLSFIQLDPSNIKKVSYVLVSPGKKIYSGFGHSIIRLEGCRKKTINQNVKKCSKANKIDLAISYSANVGTELINPFKGILGGYPSKVNITPFEEVSNTYAILENRNLKAYPLKINTYQKYLLIYRILEDFWTYQGNYKFLFNNCATEIRDLMQLIFFHTDFFSSKVKTPRNIVYKLRKNNLMETAQTYVRSSFKIEQNKIIEKLSSFKINYKLNNFPSDISKYLEEARLKIYVDFFESLGQKLKNKEIKVNELKFYLDFYKTIIKFEKTNLLYLQVHKQNELNLIFNHLITSDDITLNIKEKALKAFLKKIDTLSTFKVRNYGIPLHFNISNKLKVMHNISEFLEKSENTNSIFSKNLLKLNHNIDTVSKIIHSLQDQIGKSLILSLF